MVEKRKRCPYGTIGASRPNLRAVSPTRGLSVGEKLNRNRLLVESDIRWNWIGTEIAHSSEISKEHRLRAAGLSLTKSRRLCRNKYVHKIEAQLPKTSKAVEEGEDPEDVIVISDNEDELVCNKRRCKDSPFCLNYLGQDKWQDEDRARELYFAANMKGTDPRTNSRERGLPVGLKNLGATCYANAFIQVWFQDRAFRYGVYRCLPTSDKRQAFKDSPIFQLQVTFTALQEGNQAVFNPAKLVESLRLRTSEQQDAQEFSKLFMSHLDDEFKKQANPELRALLPSQFEGKIVNATVCDKCKTRSERESPFLELEVNIEKSGVLEDRIASLLAPERLTDDNKYHCSICDSHQDATRYTELRSLPPVLHVSVLRFVYDLETLERRKSKLPLKFPPYLNMKRFLQSPDPNQMDLSDDDEHMYELRGVLLHKGQSAYHGHYEAQVYDRAIKKWYQFNDEVVSPLKTFYVPNAKKTRKPQGAIEIDEEEAPSKRQKRAAKSRRVDSDEDATQRITPVSDPSETKYLTSKDAYMLIYARREEPSKVYSLPVSPPEDARSIVWESNEKHENECADHGAKRDAMEGQFKKCRDIVMDVYQSWNISEPSEIQECLVVYRASLEKWLSHWFGSNNATKEKEEEPKLPSASATGIEDSALPRERNNATSDLTDDDPPDHPTETLNPSSTAAPAEIIDCSALLCRHRRLNPLLDKDMKLLSTVARDKIVQCGFTFRPELTVDSVCPDCVEDEFQEKLYQIKHPQLVSRFNEVCNVDSDCEGYWISKFWLRDWQLNRPRMHVTSRGDPPPDGPDFNQHVRCEHDSLALNMSNRRRISHEAMALLKELFPSWEPPSWDEETCAVCDAQVHISKEGKLEQRRKAEYEKAQIPRLHEENVFGREAVISTTSCAIVPSPFIRAWRAWLLKPGEAQRPESLDTSLLLCEHGLLIVDLSKSNDFNEDLAVVTSDEWHVLEQLYSAGPPITVNIFVEVSDDGTQHETLVSDVSCCLKCRTKTKLNYDSTSLSVILLKPNEAAPQPRGDTQTQTNTEDGINNINVGVSARGQTVIPSFGKMNGKRQSRRIKESKGSRRQLIHIRKDMTVKDMKVEIQKSLQIPTISQRLYYRGKELDDNSETVSKLQILEKDVIYLKEIDEDLLDLDSDVDIPVKSQRKRDEGDAFGGTLLSGFMSSPELRTERDEKRGRSNPIPEVKSCPACTFDNPLEAPICSICDTKLC